MGGRSDLIFCRLTIKKNNFTHASMHYSAFSGLKMQETESKMNGNCI